MRGGETLAAEGNEIASRTIVIELTLAEAIERATTRLACERAGITDVAEFKKKAGGS